MFMILDPDTFENDVDDMNMIKIHRQIWWLFLRLIISNDTDCTSKKQFIKFLQQFNIFPVFIDYIDTIEMVTISEQESLIMQYANHKLIQETIYTLEYFIKFISNLLSIT